MSTFRTYFSRIFPRQIVLLLVLAVLLNLSRYFLFGNLSLIYILWNIFLGLIPLAISSTLRELQGKGKLNRAFFWASFVVWILFLPNAPYLVTDLVHVNQGHVSQIFYNTVLFFEAALLGMLCLFYSLKDMRDIIKAQWGVRNSKIMTLSVLLVTSFGVCFGRFLRFNSWDALANPVFLIKSVWKIFSTPYFYIHVYTLASVFFLFLVISFYAWNEDRSSVGRPS